MLSAPEREKVERLVKRGRVQMMDKEQSNEEDNKRTGMRFMQTSILKKAELDLKHTRL